MAIQIKIPTQLRPIVGGASETEAAGGTVAEVIDDLGARYPSILPRLLDEEGRLRRFVNLYVGDEDVRFLQGLVTPVEDGCCITIIPAIAGGEDVPLALSSLLRDFQIDGERLATSWRGEWPRSAEDWDHGSTSPG